MSTLFGGSSSRVNDPKPDTSLRVNTSAFGLSRTILLGGQRRLSWNLIWFGDFASQAHSQGGKGGVFGGGGKGGGVSYTYSAAVAGGICEGPVHQVGPKVWNTDGTVTTLSALNLTGFTGSYSQSAWGYLTSKHSSQADNYRGLCYCAAGPMQLGSSSTLPNITFEITSAIYNGASGIIDANPKDCLVDFLTNPYYGLGFPSARIGDLTIWRNYCQSAGIFVSPALDSQQAATQFVQDMMEITNSELVWNGGLLNVVPYGDQALSANGATYTPPSQALYSLGDDDLMPNQGSSTSSASSSSSADPIIITRRPSSQTDNIIKVEFLERTNDYNPQVVDAKDDGDIAMSGERPADLKTYHHICLRSVALQVAQLLLSRQQYRNEPVITVGPEYMLLDPMDIIEATNVALGMDNQWLRIKEITRNGDRSFVFQCEEYLYGTGSTPAYGSEAGSGYVANSEVDPGDTSSPVLMNAPISLTNGELQIWLAASGASSNWGGCDVYISLDNTTYDLKDTVIGRARYGATLTSLASHADPDSTGSVNVDLTASQGDLVAATQAQCDAYATLSMIENELVAYRDVTPISTYEYTVGPYLHRGLYGTIPATHASSSQFVRIDDNIVKIPYTEAQLGQTIYVKLPAFNIYGGGKQDISTVTAFPIVLGPIATLPDQVTGLALAHTFGGGTMDLVWNASARATQYVVNIYKSDGTTLLRSVTVTDLSFSYSAAQAALDGVQRSYKVSVTAQNSSGSAPASTQLSASNAAPAALSGVTSGSIGTGTVTFTCTASGDSDLAGYIVFFSTTSGFDPATTGSLAASAGPSITLFGLAAATYYYKMAAYDAWSSNPALLNLSSQSSFTIASGGGSTPTGGGGGGGGYGGRGQNVSY